MFRYHRPPQPRSAPPKEGEKDRHRLSGPLSGRGYAPPYDQPRQPILPAIIVAAQPAIVVVATQHGHWKTLTFIAGLRHDGIVAPCVLDGPINGESFTAWVEQFLIPVLEPGSIVVLDNLGSHKGSRVRKLLRAAGIKLFFLPPYSPDLNPIEQVIAKLKHLLRKAAERTKEAVWRRIGALLDQFTPQECENYIRNAGYGSV